MSFDDHEVIAFAMIAISAIAMVFLVGLVVDYEFATPDEPGCAVVVSKRHVPAHTEVRVVTTSGANGHVRTHPVVVHVPDRWLIKCEDGRELGCGDRDEWSRIDRGDRVILECHKGRLTGSRYLTGWATAAGRPLEALP